MADNLPPTSVADFELQNLFYLGSGKKATTQLNKICIRIPARMFDQASTALSLRSILA